MNREPLATRLQRNYVNPSLPGSFSGFESFYRSLLERGVVTVEEKRAIKEWMKGNSTYTKHRPARRKFETNRVIVNGIDDTWQLDLVDMTPYNNTHNRPFNYILLCIDVFCKYLWGKKLRGRSALETRNAFDEIIRNANGRKPKQVQMDEGTEFGGPFLNYCDDEDIRVFNVSSDKKASVVERVIRTIKDKMWRAFTDRNKEKYIDILDQLILSYNNTRHRSIKRKPIDVNVNNVEEVWNTLYGNIYTDRRKSKIKFKFNVGELVRYRVWKDMRFDKGYTQNWSQETYRVVDRLPRVPPVYRIQEENGDEMDSFYYEQELLSINREPEPLYLVERKIRRDGRGNVFVQWVGFPDHYNSWIPLANLVNVAY